ncbi:MAG TPA: MBL fold metallo-hydrolase [Dehalococcoidia bacterium]|nr:MBL fold metallo-hydrolase [Dehalococcoidia bacterium]
MIAMLFLTLSCAQPAFPLPPPSGVPAAEDTASEPTRRPGDRLTISIIYDNNKYDPRLEPRWGFSCLIEGLERTILFDTGGDSATLLHNMKELQIDLKEIDVVVLSHIHGDHVGGLNGLLKENGNVKVYLPRSFPEKFKDSIRSFGAGVNEISEAKRLMTGVYTTGELGDGIREQSLVIITSKGLVIITGCAHPGVVNIIRKAKDIVSEERVYLVMGGFHLAGESTARIQSIIEQFRQSSVEKVAPCHCSGDETRRQFRQAYGEGYIESGAGKIITIP